MPNNCDIEELPEVVFPITLQIIYIFKWKYPGLIAKLKCAKYKTDFFGRQEYYPDLNMQVLNSYSTEISKICGSLVSHLYT